MPCNVQAVSRKSGSSPRRLCEIAGPRPMSDRLVTAMSATVTRAIMPNASGNRRRVRIRFEISRTAWAAPNPISVQAELRITRARTPSVCRGIDCIVCSEGAGRAGRAFTVCLTATLKKTLTG